MPVTYQIDHSQQLIRTRCAGDVVLDDVRRHFVTLGQDPALPGRLDVLLDLSEMTTLPDADKLRVVTRDIAGLRPQVRFESCAVVAPSPALFGMLRMFEVFAEPYFSATVVVHTEAEAVRWLQEQRPPGGAGAS